MEWVIDRLYRVIVPRHSVKSGISVFVLKFRCVRMKDSDRLVVVLMEVSCLQRRAKRRLAKNE